MRSIILKYRQWFSPDFGTKDWRMRYKRPVFVIFLHFGPLGIKNKESEQTDKKHLRFSNIMSSSHIPAFSLGDQP
jgi:hypothetical protein